MHLILSLWDVYYAWLRMANGYMIAVALCALHTVTRHPLPFLALFATMGAVLPANDTQRRERRYPRVVTYPWTPKRLQTDLNPLQPRSQKVTTMDTFESIIQASYASQRELDDSTYRVIETFITDAVDSLTTYVQSVGDAHSNQGWVWS